MASTNNLFNHDEHAFDIDAPPILPTDDFEGDNNDPEDSFMGGVEMDANDDNAVEAQMMVLHLNLNSWFIVHFKFFSNFRNKILIYSTPTHLFFILLNI